MGRHIMEHGKYTDVVLSNALWDMGITFRGLSTYTSAMLRNLKTLRDLLPSEHGKLVILGLHHVNTSLCTSNICRVCNNQVFQEYFRCAQQYSAICTPGVTFVNTFQFTKNSRAANSSPDGTHFDSIITKVQMQYVLHSLCPEYSCGKRTRYEECKASILPKLAPEKVVIERDRAIRYKVDLPCMSAFDEMLSVPVLHSATKASSS